MDLSSDLPTFWGCAQAALFAKLKEEKRKMFFKPLFKQVRK